MEIQNITHGAEGVDTTKPELMGRSCGGSGTSSREGVSSLSLEDTKRLTTH